MIREKPQFATEITHTEPVGRVSSEGCSPGGAGGKLIWKALTFGASRMSAVLALALLNSVGRFVRVTGMNAFALQGY